MKKLLLILSLIFCGNGAVIAQNSLMAPGMPAGGSSMPAPGRPTGMRPTFNTPGPWMPGNYPPGPPAYMPAGIINPGGPGWQNSGTITVMSAGYDAMGVWRTIPLVVNYYYNGIQYNATVLSAWNPWTQTWDSGLSDNAVNTSYVMRGDTYDFYVVLSTGTFYFNL